jgi:hypothetical protein
MPQFDPVTPETLAGMVAELVGTPVADEQLAAVAGLLEALAGDMAAARAAEVGDLEPAFTFDPAEASS